MSGSLLAPVQITDDTQSDNPFVAQAPTLADGWQANSKAYGDWVAQQRADGVARGLIDPETGWPTGAALVDAAHQYGSALMGGTAAPEFGAAKGAAIDPIDHMLGQITADPKAKWGLRILSDPVEPGTVLSPSRVWNDGKPTDKLLSGASAVGIARPNRASIEDALGKAGIQPYGNEFNYYPGQHVHLVKGASSRKGYDVGEVIIPNAQVVAGYLKANEDSSALLPVDDTSSSTQ
jgi:hypothetical protein